ncbi:MAG TPA: outer membrane protein assembly factor BamA [Alphaproteobacteria bacterium]|nr:outer membrane protein assembly factor BamA [Alphaproteobacteria bacterium]
MQMKFMRNLLVTVLFGAVLTVLPVISQAYAETIREIRINGAQRVEPATVLTYLGVRVGEDANSDSLNQALKNLYGTGLFADVAMKQERGVLFVDVTENPIINEIAFEGNDKIKDDELKSEISLRPRQVFTRTQVQNDVSRIYEIYRRTGRFAANVDPKIIKLDQNRVNLVFEIAEGNITKIQGIRFVGNEAFSDDALRAELSTKENRWYRFLSSDDSYDPDRIEYDKELLRRFYLKEGYADFQVVSSNAELAKDQGEFFLTFSVDEGPRYRIGSVTIDSELRGYDGNELKDQVSFVPGQWYNANLVQESVDNMSNALGDKQYAFADIQPDLKRNPADDTIDVTFRIGESPRVFVERIDINGNVRTIDKVIRREMLLVEGDPFNRSKLAQSEQRLRDLGFFENVAVNTSQGSAPDKVVIDVSVSEQSTGELSIGAGFSTNDGPLADLRIRERNLLGKGQDLLFATTIAGTRTQFDASFTEPYFLDRDLSAGIDAFHSTQDLQDESSFDQNRTGGALRMGYPLSEKWRQSWKYQLENNEIANVKSTASRFIRDQQGKRTTSALSQRLTYDDRDSKLFPTEGLYSWLDGEVAGLGGDAQYISGKLGANYYIPVYKKSVIFDILGEVGAIDGWGDEDVQINERFYLGGTTLRGFERAGVGPRDSLTDDSLGGNLFYRGSAELTFPIGLPEELGVAGHAFSDFGSLWSLDETGAGILDENSLRASAGVGLSWRSPMGPIRIDFAQPIAEETFDKDEVFRFSFGTRF